MAAGDPVLINLSSATFLLTAETGVIIESFERDVDSKFKEIFNAAVGYTIGYIFYDFVANLSWSAIVNGTTGFTLAQPGVVLSVANDLSIGAPKNGVATGGIYTKTVKVSHAGEDLRKISGTALQRAGVS